MLALAREANQPCLIGQLGRREALIFNSKTSCPAFALAVLPAQGVSEGASRATQSHRRKSNDPVVSARE
eukprot:9409809-Pyramimonas_sp.AAC.1